MCCSRRVLDFLCIYMTVSGNTCAKSRKINQLVRYYKINNNYICYIYLLIIISLHPFERKTQRRCDCKHGEFSKAADCSYHGNSFMYSYVYILCIVTCTSASSKTVRRTWINVCESSKLQWPPVLRRDSLTSIREHWQSDRKTHRQIVRIALAADNNIHSGNKG